MAKTVKYFNRVMNNDLYIDQGKTADGKDKPPKVISFRNHHFTTADEQTQKEIESHPKFGTRILVVSRDHKAPGAPVHIGGVQTTASAKPTPTGAQAEPATEAVGPDEPTRQEKAVLKRAEKKIEEGKPLTALEQEVWDEFGDEE